MKFQFIFLKQCGFWRMFAAITLLFCSAVGRTAWAQALTATHCSQEEKIVFSCSFKNKKTVSLCASADLTKDTGTLQYRYGVVHKPHELVFPNEAQMAYAKTGHPKRFFSSSFFEAGKFFPDEYRSVSFQNTIFSTPPEESFTFNYSIQREKFLAPYVLEIFEVIAPADRGKKQIKVKHSCEKATTTENLSELKSLGITPYDKSEAYY